MIPPTMRPLLSRILGLTLALLPAAVFAKVNVQIDVGWNGAFRAGRWAPIYITVADDQAIPARNVIFEIVAPHDKTFGLRIFNAAAIRSDPSTNLIYVPLTQQLDETVAIIRDAATDKKLAEVPFDSLSKPEGRLGMAYYGTSANEILLGVSGVSQHGLTLLKGPFHWSTEDPPAAAPNTVQQIPNIQVGYLEPRMLPDAKVGYECLDALILGAPDLVNLAPQRQEAIATWVRAGGRLIYWPGDGIIPPESAIAKLLPCAVGPSTNIQLTLEETKKAGLPSRLEQIPARQLSPFPTAQKLDLLGGKGVACSARAGDGQVTVLSLDASKLAFIDPPSARKFWRPIFHCALKYREENVSQNPYGYNPYGVDLSETRRVAATERIIDRLGDVPGVGRFDFSYVALVMIALMFIVGPIDWFVLRKLGRQEWTWVTTGGWIALITFSALYVGHVLKSGDLYYRTVRVIDQADDQVIGVLDVTGIYSPKTQAYNLDGPRESWWEPANVDMLSPYRQSQRVSSEIAMVQDRLGQKILTRYDSHGNRVPAMVINVWNLRFMQSELGNPTQQPAALACDLKVVKNRVVGTITNRTNATLESIFITTKAGETLKNAFSLSPRQTMTVDFAMNLTGPKSVDVSNYSTYSYYGSQQRNPYSAMTEDVGFISAATDMAADRSQRIFELISNRDDLACVYALMNNSPPAVQLEHEGKMKPIEQHWQVIRALVQLGK